MIKALMSVTDKTTGEERTMLVFGLSFQNLGRLREGQPIHFRLEEMALPGPYEPDRTPPTPPEGFDVLLMAGSDEQAIMAELKAFAAKGKR